MNENAGADIATKKAACRQQAFAVRKAAHAATDPARAQNRLHAHLTALACIDVISGYMPIRTEIDPLPVMRVLADEGYRLCVPVVEGKGRPLRFRAWSPDTEMEPGAFGALVPRAGAWLEPDALITPLLAFDAAGYRLGYGGGFYDRTLAVLGAERRVYTVGFAYEAQRVASVPREATDMRLDAIVTEATTH
ncbi:MAG: 5-formyltetrahydrofolate cyclo-ligase [Pseudomonadota bacterium]